MFKKIVHYFASLSLERHRIQTQCLIEEVEQAAAQSQSRIRNRAASCTAELQSLRAQREVSIKEFAQFLSEHLEQTGEHVPLLLALQDALFDCIAQWTALKLAEARVQLQQEKIELLSTSRALLDAAEAELLRLSQQDGRHAWQLLLAQRPLRVATPTIHQHLQRFSHEVESDAKAYSHELHRIRSQLKRLKKERDALRAALVQMQTAELQPARDAYQASRHQVHDLYHRCRDSWSELQTVFAHYYQHEATESALANAWLAQLQEGGTFDELRQLGSATKSDWAAAKAQTQGLRDRINTIQSKIDHAHKVQNFATIDHDKHARSQLYVQMKEAQAYQGCLYDARQVIHSRCAEIRSFMEWIRPFHPANVVEQFHQRMAQEGDDLYRQAIGLKVQNPRHPAGQRV